MDLMLEARRFAIEGAPLSCERYGSGHINETYLLKTDAPKRYILQKINGHVFRDVDMLMRNIRLVTEHLKKRATDPRQVLTLIQTTDGESFHRSEEGCFRLYAFVENSLCLNSAESPEDFFESASAFGGFQRALADFPAASLHETIARFHDTPDRYRLLDEAIAADAAGRVSRVGEEIDFALARRGEASVMTEMLKRGELPLRVTHNDTKLNNVLLDAKTRKALCVIDLDTVMPGLAGNDFGDSIRFGASTAAEDERDLDKVSMSLPMYAVYCRGFLDACGGSLWPAERETLPMGAKLMTLECGVRFLTDYIAGDGYFHTTREDQNLDRAHTQFKLVRDMEGKWDEMRRIAAL